MKVTIELDLLNALLNQLGDAKFKDVYAIISQVQAEVGPQIPPAEAAPAPDAAPSSTEPS